MAEQSIRSLFASAERQRLEIEASRDNSNTAAYQEKLAAAITNYHNCFQLADRISLFSPNESLEDLASGDLQYLLINYHLAQLILRVAGSDRKLIIQKAREIYEEFLSVLYQYELLKGQNKSFYNQYLEDPTTFSTISTTDAESRRNTRIANDLLEREIKNKLKFLSQNPSYLQNDDEAIRNLQITNITLCTHIAFKQLEFINKEADILAMAPPTPPTGPGPIEKDHRERMGGLGDKKNEYSDKLDILPSDDYRRALDKNNKVIGILRLVQKKTDRQKLLGEVRESGVTPPTESIEEFLERQKATGGIIEGGGEASGREPTPDEDDYEKCDAETDKLRVHDEWVTENPKGAGNRTNKG